MMIFNVIVNQLPYKQNANVLLLDKIAVIILIYLLFHHNVYSN